MSCTLRVFRHEIESGTCSQNSARPRANDLSESRCDGDPPRVTKPTPSWCVGAAAEDQVDSRLIGADVAMRPRGTQHATLIDTFDRRRRANTVVAGIDRGAACSGHLGLRESAVVSQSAKLRIGIEVVAANCRASTRAAALNDAVVYRRGSARIVVNFRSGVGRGITLGNHVLEDRIGATGVHTGVEDGTTRKGGNVAEEHHVAWQWAAGSAIADVVHRAAVARCLAAAAQAAGDAGSALDPDFPKAGAAKRPLQTDGLRPTVATSAAPDINTADGGVRGIRNAESALHE